MLKQGTRLNGTYVLMEQLGSGGGGVVYKAYHERLQKYVVVKEIKDQVKGILEGRAEADILKELKHAYLPQVYDFLEIGGEIYTVMDYIPGDSLDRALEQNGSFDPRIVYRWALQLADALRYLHSQNPPVIHSDIKPANVMLTPKGTICLIDFNISLAFDEGKRTSTGISGGYSPPEQHPGFAVYQRRIQQQKGAARAAEIPGSAAPVKKTDVLPQGGIGRTDVLPWERAGRTNALLSQGGLKKTEVLQEGRGIGKTAYLGAPDTESVQASGHLREGTAPLVKKGNPSAAGRPGSVPPTESIVSGIMGRGVDERSDIYSLGATLYHLITGIRPPENFDEIIPISRFDLKIGEGFCTIIEKMMELDPAKRYQNGQELFDALEHVYELDDEYKRYRRRRRNQGILVALLYAAGAAMAGSGWMVMGRERLTSYNRSVERAGSYIEEGEYSDAEEAIENAIRLMPDRIGAYEKEALRLYSMGDYDEAIDYARDAINNPAYTVDSQGDEESLGNLFYVLGNAYFEKNDYANAAPCFEEAIDSNVKNSLYFRDYAIVLAKTGQPDEAEKCLDTAIDLGLGEDSIYMVQGEIAYSRGEDEKAAKYLEDSIRSAESEELRRRATILCAQTYQRMGKEYVDQEIGLLESSMNRFGVDVSLHLKEQLADAYARKARESEGDGGEYYGKSLELFRELYESGYSTRQMMENIGILYQQTDSLDEAESMLNQMIEKYPEDYRGYKRLAFLEADKQQKKANEERDYSAMKEVYDQAVKLYQESKIDGDTEMQMLDNMMRDLKDGGWLEE